MHVSSHVLLIGVGTLLIAAAVPWLARRAALRRVVRRWPRGVEVRRSLIKNAGDGLFATRTFFKGEVLGVYRGRVLSLLQAHQLQDRDYLMGGFGINAHVDARFALNAEGRYVNDNFDTTKLNAEFEKLKAERIANVRATRDIQAGEEIYASYGETYWRARGIDPQTGQLVRG